MRLFLTPLDLGLALVTSAHIALARTCYTIASNYKKDREIESLAMQPYSQTLRRKMRMDSVGSLAVWTGARRPAFCNSCPQVTLMLVVQV